MGASDDLVASKGNLRAYQEFETPVERVAADSGEIYAYGTGSLRMEILVKDLEREQTLKTFTTHPGFMCDLCLSGYCKHRPADGRVELPGSDGDISAEVKRVNNVYPMEARVNPPQHGYGRTDKWERVEGLTHDELVQRLETAVLAATASGETGWRDLVSMPGSPIVQGGGGTGMKWRKQVAITDLPTTISGLDTCAARVEAKYRTRGAAGGQTSFWNESTLM